jgi:hypothetical protein
MSWSADVFVCWHPELDLEKSTINRSDLILVFTNSSRREFSPLSPGFAFWNHWSIILDIPSPSLALPSTDSSTKKGEKKITWSLSLS